MNDLGINIFDFAFLNDSMIYSGNNAVYWAHSIVVLSAGERICCISNFVDTLTLPLSFIWSFEHSQHCWFSLMN